MTQVPQAFTLPSKSGAGKIDMEYGRPHISGGTTVELGGKLGVIFQPSPEEEAFTRWQNHEFLDLERLHAKSYSCGTCFGVFTSSIHKKTAMKIAGRS